MGIFCEGEDKRKQKPNSGSINHSLNSFSYKIGNMRIVDLRSSTEKNIERNAGKPLQEPLESYAQEILALFEKGLEYNIRESKLREIGEKINHDEKQMKVAYRAKFLCREAYNNGNKNCGEFSMRSMEYAWDGLGGWMK